jgi:hypothetical protein
MNFVVVLLVAHTPKDISTHPFTSFLLKKKKQFPHLYGGSMSTHPFTSILLKKVVSSLIWRLHCNGFITADLAAVAHLSKWCDSTIRFHKHTFI